jgi:lambda repressor-like predicted transcriptional regulator
MDATKSVDTRDEIVAYLKEEERSIAWLSKKTEINYNTLYSILVQKIIALSKTNLKKINEVLGTSFAG